MLSIIEAFRVRRIVTWKRQHAESRVSPSSNPWHKHGRLVMLMGIACLPLGMGCRSGAPTDWLSDRVTLTDAWQGQSQQVRSEDASFQEGWRSGFQDGRAPFMAEQKEREPAQFEAFMNSKREEAMGNWQRGYDSGFAAATASENRHSPHAQLFPNSTGSTGSVSPQPSISDTTAGGQPTRSLFGIPGPQNLAAPAPRGPQKLPESPSAPFPTPSVSPMVVTPPTPSLPPSPTTSMSVDAVSAAAAAREIESKATSNFDNAANVLQSAIRKNAASTSASEVAVGSPNSETTIPSSTEAIAPPPTSPTTIENPESEVAPPANSERLIIELPVEDDDVAVDSERPGARSVMVVSEISRSSLPGPATQGSPLAAIASANLTTGQISNSRHGRKSSGHVVANPDAAAAASLASGPRAEEKVDTIVAVPAPSQDVPVNQVAPFVETANGAFRDNTPISATSLDSPNIQVTHATTSELTDKNAVPSQIRRGLPLRKRK